MAEVLVLAEHTGGEVKKVTGELLTLARQFGEPAAVWIGGQSAEGQARLAEYGAVKVYVAEGPDVTGYVTGPEADVLAATHGYARVLAALFRDAVSSGVFGNEIRKTTADNVKAPLPHVVFARRLDLK